MHFPFLTLFLLLGSPQTGAPGAESLDFRDFFAVSPRELKPSARLLSLSGHRVRLLGYMADMEEPPRGGFYLCRVPVVATESGAGTADLPPESILVVVPSAQGQELAHIPRLLEVRGVLEVGAKVGEDGRVSAIRLLLDGPAAAAAGESVQP